LFFLSFFFFVLFSFFLTGNELVDVIVRQYHCNRREGTEIAQNFMDKGLIEASQNTQETQFEDKFTFYRKTRRGAAVTFLSVSRGPPSERPQLRKSRGDEFALSPRMGRTNIAGEDAEALGELADALSKQTPKSRLKTSVRLINF
jgi:hypothetical protein